MSSGTSSLIIALAFLAGCGTPANLVSDSAAGSAGTGAQAGSATTADAGGRTGASGGAATNPGTAGANPSSAGGSAMTAPGTDDENVGSAAANGGSGGESAAPSDGDAGGGVDEGGASGTGGSAEAPSGGAASTPDAGTPLNGGDPDLDAFRLVVIGSSTSAGEGASNVDRGWVSLLASSLEDLAGEAFSSRNLSVGGYSSESLLPDSGASGNVDDAIDEDPHLIIVALAGSNDLSAGVDGATFFERLTAIRDAGLAAGIPVFFVSTAPKDLSDEEQETLRDWADEMGTVFEPCSVPDRDADYSPCFIDVFDALANESLGIDSEFGAGDGIHLNDEGHAEIFRIAQAIVEPYVCSRVACK